MPWILAGAVAAPIVGGIIGNSQASSQQQAAIQQQQAMLQQLQAIPTPNLELALQNYQDVGQINPSLISTYQQNPSLLNNINTDPRLMNAAMQSLQTMAQVGNGGLRPEDLAAIQQVKNATNSQAEAQQQAILQNMAARGISGSGAELASRLQAGQNAANMANAQDLNTASNASQRALAAMQQAGVLGAQLQGQQFGQQAQIAAAQNAINAFNTMNAQNVNSQNTGAQNQAQYYNLGQAQQIANQNTGIANQQNMYNQALLPEQTFQNNLAKVTGQIGPSNALANTYMTQAGNTQNMYGGIGAGVGQGLSAYGAYSNNQAQQAQNNAFNQQYLNILQGNQNNNSGGSSNNSSEPGSNVSDYTSL